MHLNANKTGLVFGKMIGGLHLGWAVLVLLGLAQPLVNFIFSLHMITPFIAVMPFDLMTALGLVVFTFIVGYCVGYIGAKVWNMVYRS